MFSAPRRVLSTVVVASLCTITQAALVNPMGGLGHHQFVTHAEWDAEAQALVPATAAQLQ